jgi:uncharacterized protein
MICTIECTFCRDCVDTVLSNVCPNCAGGFEQRPIRPARVWVEGAPDPPPPSTKVVHKPVDPKAHAALVALIDGRSPAQRWLRLPYRVAVVASFVSTGVGFTGLALTAVRRRG